MKASINKKGTVMIPSSGLAPQLFLEALRDACRNYDRPFKFKIIPDYSLEKEDFFEMVFYNTPKQVTKDIVEFVNANL